MTATEQRRTQASVLALVAGAVAVVVLLVEGPPGSGYGWGSVVVSVVLVAGLFVGLALMLRSPAAGVARGSIVLAVATAALFVMALLGNWSGESTTSRVLDTVSAVLAVVACAVAVAVAWGTTRHPGG